MKWVFWGAVLLIVYAYFGYAGWLWVRSRWHRRPVTRSACTPAISIVMVVRNEAPLLENKLRNLLDLNYPSDLIEIVVASDGSTDDTNQILSHYASIPRVRPIFLASSRGKAVGLNEAMAIARGDVIVFTDARQKIESDAVRLLLENFADTAVGCASGELMLGDPDTGETARGMGLYWKIEKKIREWEAASGSVVGATGAIYAVRRELLVRLPEGTILDDVYIPMHGTDAWWKLPTTSVVAVVADRQQPHQVSICQSQAAQTGCALCASHGSGDLAFVAPSHIPRCARGAALALRVECARDGATEEGARSTNGRCRAYLCCAQYGGCGSLR